MTGFKAISLVRRKPDIDREEFARIWRGEFTAVAARLEGLRGYRVNVVTDRSGNQDWDGFAEIWFDDREAFERAFADQGLEAEMTAVREHFIDQYVMYEVSESDALEDNDAA
ncbi:MAG TPA: EthD domain-containing protein [Solirubrobacterales bacterium]|nr:EthD domain-containing protein [Solirubrobacterales bacterium]